MKLSYRSEIDGLRTIAVLSVILYHAQIVVFGHDFFKGGFVGVDIFFVISGYLISRILLSELFEKGKISFLQFYERRARRILPILFTVFLISFPLAYKYLLPNQFIEYAESILSATFFGSNIFFYFTNTQYGAEDSLLQPFLHTWSLGVEEQFYILFPIVLLLAFRFAKNHLVIIIAILILISLQYADWQSTKNTQLNFFMLTSRLWELGIGSLLAFYELKYGRVKHGLLNKTMPLLGLAMITYAIVFFNNQTPHPSFITLLPTLGTALIILYSVNTTDLVGKVLSWKPIVGVGLISYSMYLWHYPIFAFSRHSSLEISNYDKFEWIAATFILSILSFNLIERPFRNSNKIRKRAFLILIGVASITSTTIGILVAKSIIVNADKVSVSALIDNGAFRNEHRSFEVNYDYSVFDNGKLNFLIVGNSHAEDLLQSLSFSYLAEEVNLNLVSPLKREYDINYQVICFNQFLINGDTNCVGTEKGEEVVEYGPNITRQYISADVVLLATSWAKRKKDIRVINNIITAILQDGKKVVVVSNTPQSQTFGVKALNRFDKFVFENNYTLPTLSELYALENEFFFDNENGVVKDVNNELRRIVESFSDDNVLFKERSDFMCDKNEKRCFMYFPKDNAKVLWDYGHITTDGARIFGRLITEKRWLSDILQ